MPPSISDHAVHGTVSLSVYAPAAKRHKQGSGTDESYGLSRSAATILVAASQSEERSPQQQFAVRYAGSARHVVLPWSAQDGHKGSLASSQAMVVCTSHKPGSITVV